MLLAIVPAYNEAKTVGSVVRSLFSSVDQVVVVDDGSTDETADAANAAGAVVLRHELNRGQGAALETGHEYARQMGALRRSVGASRSDIATDFVLHFDADGQFDAADIEPALAELRNKGADILFGSRFLDDRSRIPAMKRFILLPIARLTQYFACGLRLSDAHNGFRILNRRALEAIHITQDRMAHATELAAEVKRANLRYIEFPVKVVYREYGQDAVGGLRIVRDLFVAKFIK